MPHLSSLVGVQMDNMHNPHLLPYYVVLIVYLNLLIFPMFPLLCLSFYNHNHRMILQLFLPVIFLSYLLLYLHLFYLESNLRILHQKFLLHKMDQSLKNHVFFYLLVVFQLNLLFLILHQILAQSHFQIHLFLHYHQFYIILFPHHIHHRHQ